MIEHMIILLLAGLMGAPYVVNHITYFYGV